MHRLTPYVSALLLTANLAAIRELSAEEQAATDNSNVAPVVELSVLPAPEPRPALKYRLIPDISERQPGNAATHYYRAIVLQRQRPKEYWQQASDNYAVWNEGPHDKFPKDEVGKWLQQQQSVLAEVKKAAYKELCDWRFRFQDIRGPEFYSLLIPEIQECRELARVLRLQARYEIFDGRYSDALETLRWGYQLAHDAATHSLIIASLVGNAIESLMNAELLHRIEASGETYYWAIASLPHPVADVRPALQLEINSHWQVFPFLKDAETTNRSPDEWRQLIVRSLQDLADLGGQGQYKGWQGELAAAALMTKLYPVAKDELVRGGMDREKIEAMPVGQVVTVHTARATEAVYHEIFKHTLLPYREAMLRLPVVMKRLEKDTIRPDATVSGKIGLPIANLFLPAVQAVLQAQVR